MATSRLGLTKPAGTVPRGVVQVETGYSRAWLDQRTRHAFGETLVRVGLGPRTEVRAGWASYLRTVMPATTVQGAGDASLGVKHRLLTNAGWVPALAVTLGSTIPTGAQAVSAGEASPRAWWRPSGSCRAACAR
ncbi:MAG TPA: transporter [Longimicrobium sp.]|nr:transporter [Longimicrobium sp.]